MQLYLCEKPSQARDIARVLGVRQKGDGCLKSSDKIVTWCFGHLLEMASPDKYDDALKRWQFDTLPIIPPTWKLTVKKSSRKQFNIIQQLLKNSSSVVIATDADREGESIAREILELCQWRGPISRLWLSALDDSSIRKALNNILPGAKTEPLYYAGLGRARADWLMGMNLTRAYTLIGRQRGHENVLSVGRVQTPTLNLVVQRDAAIEGFKPIPYFDLFTVFGVNDDQSRAKWLPPKGVADTEGRCTSQSSALNVAQKINGQRGTVTKAETELKREAAPLPFDLSSLQQEASKRWGMGAQAVLDTPQALYETHKALTYPRTDCRYLPDSQHAEVPQVFTALIQSDSQYKVHIDSADTSRRSKAWNDRKITAHHAIIPTATATDVSRMNENERRLYHLVCLRYIAQFHPDHEYHQTIIEVSVCGELFRASGRIPKKLGWRTIISNDQQETKDEEHQTLPTVSKNNIAHVLETNIEDKQTKPPARFTEGTLIAAMKSVGKDINDPRLKKILRETSGIGTEATRAGIIETLLQRGFIQKQKKHLISTATGRTLIGILPDVIKNPTTTALWEQGLDDIAQGRGELSTFLAGQSQWLTEHLRQLKQQQVTR
ncbi:MAG: DNA topoisomerase III [Candidatus Thiodiazotropha endolucinida]